MTWLPGNWLDLGGGVLTVLLFLAPMLKRIVSALFRTGKPKDRADWLDKKIAGFLAQPSRAIAFVGFHLGLLLFSGIFVYLFGVLAPPEGPQGFEMILFAVYFALFAYALLALPVGSLLVLSWNPISEERKRDAYAHADREHRGNLPVEPEPVGGEREQGE